MININDPNYFKRTIKIFMIAIIIFLIAFVLSIIFSPSLETFKNTSNGISSKLSEAHGMNKVWLYILNNAIKVPFQMFVFSLIPIPFLYFLNIISTNVITGIVFAFAIHLNFNKGIIMVMSSIPHSVVETIAMCFVLSGLYKLNQSILRKVGNMFRKTKKKEISFKRALIDLFKVYLFIALPLYILAAFLETYFTSFIYNIFT
ncbi:stage II sporulation protein M [Staphylococcus epidermidis]|uniref:stage II sporulation protein M n=1 Tax=Staphylococcus epidermidis TaxID=1282 RepID=UPI0003866DF0|nr:stage II sporulation protein M [Staphylococcus epidermidis]AJP25802.1 membrane protein [Staphylococcus epidermidis]EPZ40911.1 putative membrane protein [Staphylococcus epidermidis E13A]KAB2175880.1 stage II sporulation protein M [Staphylococcus epidermidis]MBF2214314.1 stage II sporulation protein M [Staphylococcus epidermidis]MCG2061727.1 stage II sporulation protein M [Staphylococcus epidermidis]